MNEIEKDDDDFYFQNLQRESVARYLAQQQEITNRELEKKVKELYAIDEENRKARNLTY